MENQNQFVFGAVSDQSKDLLAKEQSGFFGLNENVYLTKCEFIANAGKDGAPSNAIDVELNKGEKRYLLRIYEPTKAGFIESDKQLQDALKQATATAVHVVKAIGVTDEEIQNEFKNPAKDFSEWSQRLLKLVKSDFSTKPLDLFLSYQFTLRSENERTYLEVPRNMKQGYFLSPHITPVGAWQQETSWMENGESKQGLRYIDNAGNVHPFKKTKSFMDSPFAHQQSTSDAVDVNKTIQTLSTTATKSVW